MTVPALHRRMVCIRVNGLLAAAVLACAGCTSLPPSREPLNLSTAKAAVVRYHDSGAYHAAVEAVARRAAAWIEERAAHRRPGERLAVVFDVDETVLSSYGEMLSHDFGYTRESWRDWVERAEAPAIEPVREVYRTARRAGVEVIFLTGRADPEERAATLRNLERQGLGEFAALVMATAENRATPASQRKAAARAQLEAQGYTIIANVGDQASDLAGGHAERTFKVPNPFYLIP